jgi:hypothetical protein
MAPGGRSAGAVGGGGAFRSAWSTVLATVTADFEEVVGDGPQMQFGVDVVAAVVEPESTDQG